ncbi:OLC1v1037974C2 [Oldenlandia corymbosa var. corymbosa]|uniref:OLC1v1037974C2 n=1 Tax=Oldenlandia corymbosa var. corymbosa TaxID=529605 RepID=A0AAV1CYM7_OLDCO|nr:OLC1v1037974C2 [Oldenlandia corymbosa var. corymbosa]
MFRYMMLYTSFSDWISAFLACMGNCFGCCVKSQPIIAVDEPSKGLRIQGRLVRKPSISEDFWSTSACEIENSMAQSQRSLSSISVSNQSTSQQGGTVNSTNHSEFVNHGFLLWNQGRIHWTANKMPERHKQAEEPILSWNASYESLLGTNKRFPQPIPLAEMVDFLVDTWEQEGLYD